MTEPDTPALRPLPDHDLRCAVCFGSQRVGNDGGLLVPCPVDSPITAGVLGDVWVFHPGAVGPCVNCVTAEDMSRLRDDMERKYCEDIAAFL